MADGYTGIIMTEKEIQDVSKKQNDQTETNRIYYFYKRSGYVVENEMSNIVSKPKVLEHP